MPRKLLAAIQGLAQRMLQLQIQLQLHAGAVAEGQGVVPVEELQVIDFLEDKVLNRCG